MFKKGSLESCSDKKVWRSHLSKIQVRTNKIAKLGLMKLNLIFKDDDDYDYCWMIFYKRNITT